MTGVRSQGAQAATGCWLGMDGSPLKFQDGDYVRIDTSDRPDRMYSLPFTQGYVRGYELCEADGECEVSYELFKMGESPLPGTIREGCLIKTPEPVPHACLKGRQCGICGSSETGTR